MVSAVGLSPVQIQTIVPGAASLQFSLTGNPLPAQVWVAPSAVAVPGPSMAQASIERTASQPRLRIPTGRRREIRVGRYGMSNPPKQGPIPGEAAKASGAQASPQAADATGSIVPVVP